MKKILLAGLLLIGIGSSLSAENIKEAEKACDAGDVKECIELSKKYREGKEVKKDMTKAFELLTKACDMKDSDTCTYLGAIYYIGDDVKQDYIKANKFFSKACDFGGAMGCYFLGDSYVYGKGVKEDYFKAKEFFEKSCDGGSAVGCLMLGKAYSFGKGVRQDDFKAKELFEKACTGRSAEGCLFLGRAYDNGKGVRQDNFKANELYEKACDGESADGCLLLGIAYTLGETINKDYFKATEFFTKACDLEDAKGCYFLGESYANGRGVRQDDFKAKELYGKACDLKDSDGCEKYATLNTTTKNNPSYEVYNISGNGEECSATFTQNGKLYKTTCLSLTNSKGIKILCTKNKKICKTEDELTGSLPQNTETDTTATAICTSKSGNLGTLKLTQSANGSLMRIENLGKGTDLGLFELGTAKSGDRRYYGPNASVYVYKNHKAISIRGSDSVGQNHTRILGVWDCTHIKWR